MSRLVIALFVVEQTSMGQVEDILQDAASSEQTRVWLADPTNPPSATKEFQHFDKKAALSWTSCFLSKTPHQCGDWLDLLRKYSDRMTSSDDCKLLDKTQFLLYDTRLRKFAKCVDEAANQRSPLPMIILSPGEKSPISSCKHLHQSCDSPVRNDTASIRLTKLPLFQLPNGVDYSRRVAPEGRMNHTRLTPLEIGKSMLAPSSTSQSLSPTTAFEEDDEMQAPWPLTPWAGTQTSTWRSAHLPDEVSELVGGGEGEWMEVLLEASSHE